MDSRYDYRVWVASQEWKTAVVRWLLDPGRAAPTVSRSEIVHFVESHFPCDLNTVGPAVRDLLWALAGAGALRLVGENVALRRILGSAVRT